MLGRYYTYLDIWVERVISINIKNNNDRFIQALSLSSFVSIVCLLYMYTRQFLMLITVRIISTRIYLSLHDTWHSPEDLLGVSDSPGLTCLGPEA